MDSRGQSVSPALARALLALAAFGMATSLALGIAWWRSARSPRGLDALAPQERLALMEDALAVSPGIYVPAWFEPRIGYTLVPGREIEAWGTRVAANELGYRSPPASKPDGVFRILFLGDSWTFGMGVEAGEAFPARVAELANAGAGAGTGTVQAWSLALPGYNLLNQLTALSFFEDRLRPDAVVVCPTPNDVNSTATVLPNGSLGRAGIAPSDFGEPMSLAFRSPFVDSPTLRRRWRLAMELVAGTEARLAERGIPLLVFFTGTWPKGVPHRLVAEGALDGPYAVTPSSLTTARWRNPPPIRHPTPEAHRLYARIVYRALARRLGWELPPPGAPELGSLEPEVAQAVVHRRGEATGWPDESAEVSRRQAEAEIPVRFRPGEEAFFQAAGPIDHRSGEAGRETMVQVRRAPWARALRVTLAPVDSPSLGPLGVTLEVPSEAGGTGGSVTVPAAGAEPVTVEIALPSDLPEGSVVDLFLRADRAVAAPDSLAARAFVLLGVEPVTEGPGDGR